MHIGHNQRFAHFQFSVPTSVRLSNRIEYHVTFFSQKRLDRVETPGTAVIKEY